MNDQLETCTLGLAYGLDDCLVKQYVAVRQHGHQMRASARANTEIEQKHKKIEKVKQ